MSGSLDKQPLDKSLSSSEISKEETINAQALKVMQEMKLLLDDIKKNTGKAVITP